MCRAGAYDFLPEYPGRVIDCAEYLPPVPDKDPEILLSRYVLLEDGTIFRGYSFGAKKSTTGEAVFSTSMVGYPEALTDPSYRGQILCLTYPLIGNYGVPSYDVLSDNLPAYFESNCIQVRGLIVHEVCEVPSHHQSVRTLHEWLKDEDIPGIYGVDTRRLARILRERGVMLGAKKFHWLSELFHVQTVVTLELMEVAVVAFPKTATALTPPPVSFPTKLHPAGKE